MALEYQRKHRSRGFIQDEIEQFNDRTEESTNTCRFFKKVLKTTYNIFTAQALLCLVFLAVFTVFLLEKYMKDKIVYLYWTFNGCVWSLCISYIVLMFIIVLNRNIDEGPSTLTKDIKTRHKSSKQLASEGLFYKLLIAYKEIPPPSKVERNVYIPTRPNFQGDTGYIDLRTLGEKGSVVFKIPVNSSWIQHYRWSLDGEKIPYVEDFKIYLPRKEYKPIAEREHTTTRVTIKSIGGNSVSTIAPDTSAVYILPPEHSTYVTVYEEGFSSCKSTYRVPNPYSLCNNLPDICDKSSSEEESLLPTILSSWELSFKTLQGLKKLKWEAPNPSTNLMIKATLRLRFKRPGGKRRNNIPRQRLQRLKDKTTRRNLCCDTGNKYRDRLEVPTQCKTCPQFSTSKLRGLYCEIGQETELENESKE